MASGIEVAQAYVTIIPSMKDSQRTIAKDLGAETVGQQAGREIGDGIQNGISVKDIAIGQVLGNIVTDAARKAADTAKQLIGDAFAGAGSYEQLTGGIEKLFGGDAQRVIDNAQGAYMTAGKSANEYMEQVTGLAGKLVNSTGGDTAEAARLADQAIRDMSDNVNVFGTDAEGVQNAIMGIAKGNYSMLDNLSLGFDGSKQGMVDLINASGILDHTLEDTGDLADVSFAQMLEAIHKVQTDMGITDTTVKEAMGTLEGSANATKAAWENVLTAVGTGDSSQLESAVTGLIDSLFGIIDEKTGEREGGLIENVLRIGGNVARSVAGALPSLVGEMFANLPAVVGEVVAGVMGSGNPIVEGFKSSVDADALGYVFANASKGITDAFGQVASFIGAHGEQIGSVLGTVANAIGMVVDAVSIVVETVAPFAPMVAGIFAALKGYTIISSIVGAISTFVGMATTAIGMIGSVPGLIAVVTTALGGPVTIIVGIVGAIAGFIATNEEARNVVIGVWNQVKDTFTTVMGVVVPILSAAWETIKSTVTSALSVVSSVVSSVLGTVKTTFSNIWDAIKTLVQNAIDRVKSVITGISTIVGSVQATFNSVKDAIMNPINSAKDAVSNAIGRIKDIINNAHLKLPHFALPHFNINGGELPWGIGGKGYPPSISVSWYARGGYAEGAQLIGVGERGGEFIWPSYDPYLDHYAEALASHMDGTGNNIYIDGARINDDAEIRDAMLNFLVTLQRRGAMNVGTA